MKSFLKSKAKILFVCLFVCLTLTGCTNPRGADGKTRVDQIISSETIEVQKKNVNVTDISDKKLKEEYAKLGDEDTIKIEPLTFKEALSAGWFDGLIVWPIAQVINFLSGISDAGFGIILTTLLIQVVVFVFTRKSQMGNQRMQEIQPEIQRIQDKYKDKTDDRSKMMMYQETQKIYTKYDIHPFGPMIVTFIQFPILIGMYYATMRASSVVYGSFLGLEFIGTPMDGFKTLQWGYIAIYVLMILCQLLSLKMPQLLKKHQDKIDHVKKKDYNKDSNSMMKSMNMYMYFSVLFMAFLCFSWPIAMSFYWAVSSLINVVKSILLHQFMNKKA